MRNLSRLTHATNRLENGPKQIDRRKLPMCAEEGCRRKVEALSRGEHIDHCYEHATDEEREQYQMSWDTHYIKKESAE